VPYMENITARSYVKHRRGKDIRVAILVNSLIPIQSQTNKICRHPSSKK
jgi:hypothetical protein